jgi:hypothetical protein
MNASDDSGRALPAAVQIPGTGLLVDLGKQSRAEVKELRQGHGRLCEHLAAVVDGARHELGISADVEIIPIVLLYRRDDQANGGYTVLKIDR